MALTAGTLLNNRYRIVSILGQGGMGAVYRAVDEHLGVSVAVKENLFLTDEYARQFQREASILAGLHHANVPRVRDYFTVPGQGQYLVMDFIEGEDLRARIERERVLSEKEVILIGVLICDALAYLHSRQPAIVHRDIKPGNIKITPEGEAYLVDFGLAKILSPSQATSTGARAMTPGFSPPEQYGTARTDARTDIYSLGATLYAVITGMIPEDGLARATHKEDLTRIRDLEPKVSRRLAAAIEKALELEPEARYQTAQEFRDALVEAGEVNPASVNRLTVPPPPISSENAPVEIPDGDLDPADAKRASLQRSSHARRRRTLLKRLAVGIPLAAVLLGVIIILAQPPRSSNIPAPTPTVSLPGKTDIVPTPVDTDVPTAAPTQVSSPVPPTSVPTPKFTATPLSAGLPQIAFASNRSGSMQIWLMDADGGGLIQLTNNPSGSCQPAWAPDGEQIAFVSPCLAKDNYAGGRIYAMDADGTNIHPLAIPNNPEGDYDPAWSPDGKNLAFTSRSGNFTQIFKFNFQTSTSINISNSKSVDSNPAWSPDGKLIAFSRLSVNSVIWLMTPDGSDQAQLYISEANTNSFNPTWTPDGKFILFSQNKSSSGIPWLTGRRVTDHTTTGSFRIPANGTEIGPVAGANVSRDGEWIVFESWPNGKNHDIFLITINGTNLTQLTTDPAFDFSPAFRP